MCVCGVIDVEVFMCVIVDEWLNFYFFIVYC